MDTNTATIKSLKIEGLFEIFDYDVEYPTSENVLILTGPNGFGKTKILNILFNLFNRRFVYFKTLVFNKIIVTLNNNISIEILKNSSNEDREVVFSFLKGQDVIEKFEYSLRVDRELIRALERYLPLGRIDKERWMDHSKNRVLSLDEVITEYSSQLPDELSQKYGIKSDQANEILDSINVHLIREQRLFKKVAPTELHYRGGDQDQTIMIETIQTYSDELRGLIVDRTQESYVIAQTLDSSYPNRLISEKKKVSKQEYDEKFKHLKEKQDKLTKYGLYENTREALEYNEVDAKALLVYLNDLEKKLQVFDDLLEKLELFSNILNERRFTFKSINVSRDNGFYFTTTINNKELELNQLSSGEQHEVVLLYELIFKTSAGILVLIDEPEISLHITWQKEFLDDLLRIIKIQNFQVLIATHSPSIINDRWDLVYNLEKKMHT